jgi:hypothetical protein
MFCHFNAFSIGCVKLQLIGQTILKNSPLTSFRISYRYNGAWTIILLDWSYVFPIIPGAKEDERILLVFLRTVRHLHTRVEWLASSSCAMKAKKQRANRARCVIFYLLTIYFLSFLFSSLLFSQLTIANTACEFKGKIKINFCFTFSCHTACDYGIRNKMCMWISNMGKVQKVAV